jgi:hypothetical protein
VTEPRKRTPAELWTAIERVADEAELARIDALGDEELDRELRQAGIDPDAAAGVVKEGLSRSRAPAPLGVTSAEARSQPAPSASRNTPGPRGSRGANEPRARAVRWVAWAAAAALVGAVALVLARRDDGVAQPAPADAAPRDPEAQRREAARLRAEASDACARSQWTRCEENLDQARALDPAGEADPSVARLRDAVRAAARPR